MGKKAVKTDSIKTDDDAMGLDVISVRIKGKSAATYTGLGGTFAGFLDSCLRKQVLPGFHEQGLIAGATYQGSGFALCLSGKRSDKKLKEIMDIALINAGAYPDATGKAKYFVDVESEK